MSPIADDRLRLIFTCCHPALALEAQVALTLRTLGGLTTPEIARAFLVPEPTLAQRLVRAKRRSATPASRTACRRRAPARAARRRAAGPLSRLQRGLCRVIGRRADPARAVRRGDPARPGARRAHARRARGARPPRADAPARRAARRADGPDGEFDPARGPGSVALGPGPRSTRGGAGRTSAPRCAGRARTRSRPRSPRVHDAAPTAGGDRLDRDRRALRRARGDRAVPGRRAQPGRRGRDGRRPGGRASRCSTGSPTAACSTTTTSSTPRGPTCSAGSTAGRRRRSPTAARIELTGNEAERDFLARRLAEVGG